MGNKQNIIYSRVNDDEFDLIKRVCAGRGENISIFVRRSVRTELARMSYLSDEDKKSLGLNNNFLY